MTWVLIALWVLWALLLGSSLVAGGSEGGRARGRRLASSLTLVGAGWAWVAATAGQAWTAYALPVAVGMSCGFVGDLFMAGVLPARQATLAGMAAFALNHVAYWVAFLLLVPVLGLGRWVLPAFALLVWLAVGAYVWRITAGASGGPMRWPALVYTLLLAGTAGLGLGLALSVRALAPLALGGALFFVSDGLIAGRLFRGSHHPHLNDCIWLTYGPAQMLIVYGLTILLR